MGVTVPIYKHVCAVVKWVKGSEEKKQRCNLQLSRNLTAPELNRTRVLGAAASQGAGAAIGGRQNSGSWLLLSSKPSSSLGIPPLRGVQSTDRPCPGGRVPPVGSTG